MGGEKVRSSITQAWSMEVPANDVCAQARAINTACEIKVELAIRCSGISTNGFHRLERSSLDPKLDSCDPSRAPQELP